MGGGGSKSKEVDSTPVLSPQEEKARKDNEAKEAAEVAKQSRATEQEKQMEAMRQAREQMLLHEAMERQKAEERKQQVIEDEDHQLRAKKRQQETSTVKPGLQPYVRGQPSAPVGAQPAAGERPGSRQKDRNGKEDDGARTLQRTSGNEQLHQPAPVQKATIQTADYGKVELNKINQQPSAYMASRNHTDSEEDESEQNDEDSDYVPSQGVRVQVGVVQYEGAISPRAPNAPAAGDFNYPQGKGKFTTGLMQTDDNYKHDQEANRRINMNELQELLA